MGCLACARPAVAIQVDLGCHPVASLLLETRDAPQRLVHLALGQCENCGTIQLVDPVPHDALVPPFAASAREPEAHLDDMVEHVAALPGLCADSVVGGLTSIDDTTIDRFVRKGFLRHWRMSLEADFGVKNPAASIETVQSFITPARMAAIAARHGAADILIVRRILEHAEDLQAFIRGIAELVKPGGVVIVEVPDCAPSLENGDYCMVWEEHSLYFTPKTFAPVLAIGGFDVIRNDIYPYPFENSLVQIARKVGPAGKLHVRPVHGETGMLKNYAERYEPACRRLRARLEKIRAETGPIALFGAGHLAAAFANFMGVADLIDFVADDTPQKQGKFLPGARLPILPSVALVERKISLCLLALSIGSEETVIARNQTFTAQGGTFRSILRQSPRSIFIDCDYRSDSRVPTLGAALTSEH